jgi:uncharacterized membrane protein
MEGRLLYSMHKIKIEFNYIGSIEELKSMESIKNYSDLINFLRNLPSNKVIEFHLFLNSFIENEKQT